MSESLLVASHVSSLPRPPPVSIVVSTTRTNAPFPSNTQHDLPDEHALFSSVLHNDVTGTIILRVIHGGTILELMSLSANVSPLRFVLPATILPSPGLFIWEQSSLHVLLVTDIGSIFRLIVPINGLKLWQEHIAGDGITFRESYLFHPSIQDIRLCSVHAQGIDSLAVSVPNGGLMRLESDFFTWNEQQEEQWTDTLFHHTSFLSSLTSLLHSSVPGASDIISMASHPWPTDVANVWTLSRDRTLRLWKAKLGCAASKSLPITPSKHEESKSNLLDQEYQNLVKVFSQSTGELFNVYALVFIPTPTTQSGGFFTLFDTSSDQLIELGAIQCPKNTSRCHLQDFAVRNGRLYALWDRQGQAFISSTEIDFASMSTFEPQTHVWKTAEYAETLDLTPAYMEERLLAPGSMTSILLDAILKPGVFSALTLRTALDRYTDSCLSVPGAPPPQLLSTYGSLSENIAAVVGCTVTLNRDPQTGGYQHANYWTALKRDWEGFVARCKEVERNARWPLSIAVTGDGNVIFVERERIGSLYVEDVPLGYHRLLERDKPLHLDHALFETMWGLRCKLGPHTLATLEMRMTDVMKQEIAFSFSEVLQDQADRLNFQDSLEEGAKEWFDERLRSIVNIDQAIRGALDSIGALDLAVKPEETDSMSLDAVEPPVWHRTQAVGYASATVRARYDLCLSLIVFLLFIADDLSHWEPSLLTEIFAVFRGIATLRYSANRSIEGDQTSPPNPQSSTDDVVAQMRNMNVSNSSQRIPLKTSLLQLLISQTPVAETVPVTAHNFLDSTGILQSLSTAYVTKHEAAFCNHVLALGLLDASRELLSWLPRTPAATFLQAQVFLRFGRPDDAAELLEKLAGVSA